MLIIYSRHGETKKGLYTKFQPDNAKLTSLGRIQSKQVAKYLKHENITKIYCAPSLRTQSTAKIIAKTLGVSIEACNELRERVGINLQDIKTDEDRLFLDNYLNLNYEDSKRETCSEYFQRNFKLFDKIITLHQNANENILIVAHSSTLYAISAYFHGIQKDGSVIWMQCSNCTTIKFEC